MKKIVFALAFMLIGSIAFANSEITNEKATVSDEIEISQTVSTELFYFSEIKNSDVPGCTIVTGTQVISNGEVVYQEVNTWHTDAFESCEAMWQFIANALMQ